MRALSAILMSVLVIGLTGMAPIPLQEKDDPAAKIVGKWEIIKSDSDAPVGTIVEFTKDGKLKIETTALKIEGTYKIDKDKLMTVLNTEKEKEKEEVTDTIKSLTDDELVLEDTAKKTTTMKRKK